MTAWSLSVEVDSVVLVPIPVYTLRAALLRCISLPSDADPIETVIWRFRIGKGTHTVIPFSLVVKVVATNKEVANK